MILVQARVKVPATALALVVALAVAEMVALE